MIGLAAIVAGYLALVVYICCWAERDHRAAQRAAEEERAGRRRR